MYIIFTSREKPKHKQKNGYSAYQNGSVLEAVEGGNRC